MAQIKTTIPPMMGRTAEEKQEAVRLYDSAKAYLAENKSEGAMPLLRRGALLGHTPALLHLAKFYWDGKYVETNRPLAVELLWQAASHGNIAAQRSLAHIFYFGLGLQQNYEEAVSWMMTAAQDSGGACADLAKWYEAAPLNDPRQAQYWRERAMAIERDNKAANSTASDKAGAGDKSQDPLQYSHKKEFYRESDLADRRFFEYGGQIYYFNDRDSSTSKLCVSDLNGGNARILADVGEFDRELNVRLAVNCTGIYLYDPCASGFQIQKYDLSGSLAGKYRMVARQSSDDEYFYNFYIYGHMVYCALKRGDRTLILSLDTNTGERKELYDRADRIDRLTASEDCLIFQAWYTGETADDDGWMVFDLAAGQVRCLSNTQCSPENVLSNPKYYDEDSPLYLKCSGRKERNIAWVDPARGIFWQEYTLAGGEGIVWRACSLSDGKPRADIPEWRTASIARNGSQEYFDGNVHFFAPTYYKFWGLDRTGQVLKWSLDNGEDGECDQFAVLGGRLFINTSSGMQTKYSIYPLSAEMPEQEGADWFSDPLPGSSKAT